MRRRVAVFTLLASAGVGGGLWATGPIPSMAPPVPQRVINSVTSFATGHPEWAVLRDGRKDVAALRMNHEVHMSPGLKGGPLSCNSCHLMEDDGRYMAPISFDQHCVQCHADSLGRINVADGLIDPIGTPHGDVDFVRGLIASQLNALVATNPEKFVIVTPGPDAPAPETESSPSRRRGKASKPEVSIPAFTAEQERTEWLAARGDAAVRAAQQDNRCGYCHEQAGLEGAPREWSVVPPAIPDRWLTRSHYSHAAHSMLSCDECHSARSSQHTSDILMPSIESCRECHQPRQAGAGGAPTDCVLCHTYHAPAPQSEGRLRTEQLLRSERGR